MDNTEAVEKLVEVIFEAQRQKVTKRSQLAQEILAAIQADLIGYFPPKPLEWMEFPPRKISDEIEDCRRFQSTNRLYELQNVGAMWAIMKDDECIKHVIMTLEAAQAAAYDDLVSRAKELF